MNNTLTNKHDFIESTGFEPYGSLTLHREKFYGITYSGYNSKAAIFEWDPQTNIYSKQVDFNAPVTGNRPHGYMTFCDGSFYGMTEDGGSLNGGTLFEWNPMSNLLTSRIDFNGYNCCNPLGSLTHNDGKLYGLTCFGGEFGCGNLFEWDPATDIFLSKIGFDDLSSGCYPFGSLIYSNGKFYGMTYGGGLYGNGTIFEWDLSDNSFVKLLDFDGVNGGTPWYSELTEFNYSPSSTTWTGLVNSDWLNIDNWNPCIPQSNTNVIIPSDAFNFPTITVPVSCAGLTIENGASFIGSEFLNVPAGAVQIKRNITDTKSHYLSSPVSNSTFGGVFSTSHAVWAREYVTNNDSWIYRFLSRSICNRQRILHQHNYSTYYCQLFFGFRHYQCTPVIVMNLSHDNDGWNLLGESISQFTGLEFC
ncbi:MAG: hypothetical protein IPH45_18225 [Bacteroidales bacterium]|nr:hypothetical protein [Bacteroidales bacterium]